MAPRLLLITLSIVGVTCAIAVLLARRWQLRLAPACLAAVGWSAACFVGYYFILSGWPPIPWTEAARSAEPWESIVYPIMLLSIIWPLLSTRLEKWSNLLLIAALALSCLPLIAALCEAERFAKFHFHNTHWSLAALMAIAINWLALERMERSGAGRWCLWIAVGQLLTVAALIMTCYGRFGEWATIAGLSLGVVALARVLISDPQAEWSARLAYPALALSAILLMHVREYRSNPLPVWFLPLPFLLPMLVALNDWSWAHKQHPILRVFVAAVLTASLAAGAIAFVWVWNGPSDEW